MPIKGVCQLLSAIGLCLSIAACGLLKPVKGAALVVDSSGRVVAMTPAETSKLGNQVPVVSVNTGEEQGAPFSEVKNGFEGFRPVEELDKDEAIKPKRFFSLPDEVGNTPGTIELVSGSMGARVVTETARSGKRQGLPVPRGEAYYSGALPDSLGYLADLLPGIEDWGTLRVSADGQGRLRPDAGQVLVTSKETSKKAWGIVTPVISSASSLKVKIFRKPRCEGCFFNPTVVFLDVSGSGVGVLSAYHSGLSEWFPRSVWGAAYLQGEFDVPSGATDLLLLSEEGRGDSSTPAGYPDLVVEWK